MQTMASLPDQPIQTRCDRRDFLRAAATASAGVLLAPSLSFAMPDASTKPKNIVFITTHDSGRHFGCYGVRSAPTPHIDRLASEGMRFDRMFSVCSICSPSRAAMMTGHYPQRNGVLGLTHAPYNWCLNPGSKHLSHLTREAGYQTALIGHYHETMDPARDLAFDHTSHYTTEDKQSFLPYTSAAQVADGVDEWISTKRDPNRPFFLQIGFFETHKPFDHGHAKPYLENGVDVPQPVVDNAESREYFAEIQGALGKLDEAMGRILAAIDAAGLEKDTQRDVIFAELTNDVQNAHLRCARSGSYKLILNFAARRGQSAPIDMSKPPRGAIAPSAELYDLETDPYETENLAESPAHRETFRRMADSLRGWLRETGDPILKAPVPTPYYEETRQRL